MLKKIVAVVVVIASGPSTFHIERHGVSIAPRRRGLRGRHRPRRARALRSTPC